MAGQAQVTRVVLTAWDGGLFGAAEEWDEACERLMPVMARLKAASVPVVVFTERDRAEVEPVRERLGWIDPFITESGSAIFTLVDHNPFKPALGEKEGNYFVEMLGCPYVQARAGLRVIANVVSHPLKGFGDYTVPQLERAAGLSEAAAHRAKAREFSEPFMTPKAVDAETLQQAAEEMGFGVIWRSLEESRYSELLGAGAGLGEAAKRVIAAYGSQLDKGTSLSVTGISNRAEDLAVLAEVCQQLDGVTWSDALIKGEGGSEAWMDAISPLLNADEANTKQ